MERTTVKKMKLSDYDMGETVGTGKIKEQKIKTKSYNIQPK